MIPHYAPACLLGKQTSWLQNTGIWFSVGACRHSGPWQPRLPFCNSAFHMEILWSCRPLSAGPFIQWWLSQTPKECHWSVFLPCNRFIGNALSRHRYSFLFGDSTLSSFSTENWLSILYMSVIRFQFGAFLAWNTGQYKNSVPRRQAISFTFFRISIGLSVLFLGKVCSFSTMSAIALHLLWYFCRNNN